MSHKSEIVAWKQVNDTTIAFLARCCGDESTDSWHTVSNLHTFENAQVEKSVKVHMSNVESKHLAAARVREHIVGLFPDAKEHTGEILSPDLHTNHSHPSELETPDTPILDAV
jgi:hypothetical protein